MKRAFMCLVSMAVAASTIAAPGQAAATYDAHVWSNSDAFKVGCLGVNDTYPQQLYSLTVTQLGKLGFAPVAGALGPGFTRAAVLGDVLNDWAVYVHSHGDNYWAASGAPNIDSGFLQDPGAGKCNSSKDIIRASSIKAATQGSFYNIVIMSTCMLGSNSSTMPAAFQIEKTKQATDYEFYLGYVYHTWDSSSLAFREGLLELRERWDSRIPDAFRRFCLCLRDWRLRETSVQASPSRPTGGAIPTTAARLCGRCRGDGNASLHHQERKILPGPGRDSSDVRCRIGGPHRGGSQVA